MKLEELIQAKSKHMGGSWRQLGAATGIRPNTLSDYDRGVAISFKQSHVEIFFEFFQITGFDELFEFVEEAKPADQSKR